MTGSQPAPRQIRLTQRECDCLRWCSKGKTNWEISRILGLSERTVEHYLSRANRKLGTSNRAQAVALALKCGFI
jgi:LuxR family transcriptional regulator, quorum-sensing system regulator BjaR1